MKKITNKQVFLSVLLIGVVACLLVYMLVFTPYNDKTAALKTSNAALKAEVDDMKQYYDNREVYRQETAAMIEGIGEMTADYPADSREEDAIMMAVDMNSAALINFDQINIDSPEVILEVPEETVAGAQIEGMEGVVDFVRREVSYSNITDYSNLKAAVAKVYDSPYRIGVSAVSYKKDSDDNNFISGTIDIMYYSLSGMGKEYEPPKMPEYFGGASDLFGILTYAAADDGGAAEVPPEEPAAE